MDAFQFPATVVFANRDVFTIDVSATHVKILGRRQKERREFGPGHKPTPKLKSNSSANSLIRKIRDTL
jgi:hypothetical protein